MVALAKWAQHVELVVLCRHAPRDVLSTAMLLQMQKRTKQPHQNSNFPRTNKSLDIPEQITRETENKMVGGSSG